MEQMTLLKPLEDFSSESEKKRKQLEEEFSYDGYMYVRGELFANQREPAITFRNGNITFNTACINGLEDVVFVNLLINEGLKRIVVRGCSENDKDSLRWCIAKPDKRKSRKMTCPDFTNLIYGLMGWQSDCRYKIIGYRIEIEGETLYIFDLNVHKIFKETAKSRRSKGETTNAPTETKEAVKPDRKGFYPEDIANTFGIPVEDHNKMMETVDDLDGFVSVGAITGDQNMKKESKKAKTSGSDITIFNNNEEKEQTTVEDGTEYSVSDSEKGQEECRKNEKNGQ